MLRRQTTSRCKGRRRQMRNRIITAKQSESLHVMLSDLLVLAEADAIFVCDTGGNIIDNISQTDDSLDQTIAALASGSFAATGELAMLIGEATFRSVFHKGEKNSIYMQNLSQDYLILVIFSKNTTIGMVKLHITKAAKAIELLLGEVNDQTVTSSGSQTDFAMKSSSNVFEKTSSGVSQ